MPAPLERRIRADQNRWSTVRDRAMRLLFGWRRRNWRTAFSTPAEIESFMQHYYQYPRPEFVVLLYEFLDSGDHLPKALGSLGFLVEFLASNPDWQEALFALGASGSSLLKGVLKTATEIVPLVDESALKLDEHSLVANDFYWAAFFASGKLGYVDHLIEESMLVGSPDRDRFEVGATAQWSLAANVRQHAIVETHVLQRRDELDGRRSQLLTDALDTEPSLLLSAHAEDFQSFQQAGEL